MVKKNAKKIHTRNDPKGWKIPAKDDRIVFKKCV